MLKYGNKTDKEGKMKRQSIKILFFVVLSGGVICSLLLDTFRYSSTKAQETGRYEKAILANQIQIVDKNGNSRISLSVLSDGSPDITLFNTRNQKAIRLGMYSDGSPVIQVYDGNGKVRIELVVLQEKNPLITVYDREGRSLWVNP